MNEIQNPAEARRLGGLRRFAVAITILNILGHTVFGFEQSWAQPLVALAAAYSIELLLESIDAWATGRRPKFAGTPRQFVDFLLSAHITGLAVRHAPLRKRAGLGRLRLGEAIASKCLLRAPVGRGRRHFFNPSNFGITITLLVFLVVSVAPPYQFTEHDGFRRLDPARPDHLSGTFLNARFTDRLPLIAAWVGGFVVQACVRSFVFDTPLAAALVPMTGVAFILYTFYMVTDPATTPSELRDQIWFGASVAAVYGFLVVCHVVFGLFFALTIVCTLRGVLLYMEAYESRRAGARITVPPPAIVTEA